MLALCEFLRDNYSLAAVSFSTFSSSNFILDLTKAEKNVLAFCVVSGDK